MKITHLKILAIGFLLLFLTFVIFYQSRPSYEEMGLADVKWYKVSSNIGKDASTSVYATNLDCLVSWLVQSESFNLYKKSDKKTLDEIKNNIFGELRFKNSSLLIEKNIEHNGKLYVISVKCNRSNDLNNVFVVIKINYPPRFYQIYH